MQKPIPLLAVVLIFLAAVALWLKLDPVIAGSLLVLAVLIVIYIAGVVLEAAS